MARIPLEIGEWGNIRRIETPDGPAARANFRDGRGQRINVQRSGKSPAAAEANLKEALRSMAKAAVGDGVITHESTIDELAEFYFDEMADDSAKDGTLTTYRSNYRRHIKGQIGSVKIRQITVARLQQVIRAQKDKPPTAKGIRVVLINLFALAVRHDAIKINLAANTKPVKIERKKVEALTPHQVKSLLRLFELSSTVNGKDIYDEVLLLASTGTRTGEVLAVEWSEMNLDNDDGTASVRITGTLVEDANTGKLKKQDEGKTVAATRGMMLPPTAAARFRARYELSDSDYVFPSRAGTYQWPNNFRRRWRAVIEGTEFEGISPKKLRKAVGTHIARSAGTEAAQAQLGHESDDTTKEFYIEQEEKVTNFAEILEGLIRPGEAG